MNQQREAQVKVRRVRDGGPGADAQWWAVTADSNLLSDTRDWDRHPIRSYDTDLHAEAGVQSLGRGLWAVWGYNPETRQSFLDSTFPSRETATAEARRIVLDKVLPVTDPEPEHAGRCQWVARCTNTATRKLDGGSAGMLWACTVCQPSFASDGPCVICGQYFPPDAPWSSGHDGAGEHRCHVEPEPVAMDFRVVDAGRSGPTAATTVRVYGDTTGGAILDLSRNYAVPAPHGMLGEVILTPAEVDHLIAALQQTKRS